MRNDQRSPEPREKRPHSHLYDDWRWRGPNGRRIKQLKAEPLCRLCKEDKRLTPATVADHVVRHNGDTQSFFKGELQSLCAECHSSRKQKIEVRGFDIAVGFDGWPIDKRHPANKTAR